jgi:flavin-dependent dehydrogenase
MAPGQLDTDVIIAGGGPAGAATAIACIQRGLRVHLFERAAFSERRPGETLHPGVEPLLRQLGLADRFQATVGARHPGIWLCWGGQRRFQRYGSDQDGAWQGFQISRLAFDQLLLSHASELGVVVRQPCAIDRVQLGQEDRVCVLTAAGPLSARVIVDATGRASWLSRQLHIARDARSPRLIARYGYAAGSCSGRYAAPELEGNSEGWVWTAMVQPALYHWTCVTANGARPNPNWVPEGLRRLRPVGPSKGADVTWHMAARLAHPAWFIVGDAACLLDPLSSKGVLRAMMTGIATGYLIANGLNGQIAPEAAANVYQSWLSDWFEQEALRLSTFYRELGVMHPNSANLPASPPSE